MTLVSKFMVYRALSDKTYLLLGLRSPLIKWLRPKGLKVCSYVEKYAEFKNQFLKKIRWYTNWLFAKDDPWGDPYHKLASNWGTIYLAFNLTYLSPLEQFLMGAKLYPGTSLSKENNVLKNKPVLAM